MLLIVNHALCRTEYCCSCREETQVTGKCLCKFTFLFSFIINVVLFPLSLVLVIVNERNGRIQSVNDSTLRVAVIEDSIIWKSMLCLFPHMVVESFELNRQPYPAFCREAYFQASLCDMQPRVFRISFPQYSINARRYFMIRSVRMALICREMDVVVASYRDWLCVNC